MNYRVVKLKEWIDINKIDTQLVVYFTSNPNAYDFILSNPKYFGDNAEEWLCNIYYKKEHEKWNQIIKWNFLSLFADNKYSINILENNLDKIYWDGLSSNPNTIHILENNIDKIDWFNLCYNNDNAYKILNNHFDKIEWLSILHNKNAIYLIREDVENLTWNEIYDKLNYFVDKYNVDKKRFIDTFSSCNNKYVLKLLDKNPCEIDWYLLCKNKDALFIIKKHLKEIHLYYLCNCKDVDVLNYVFEHIDEYNKKYDIDYIERNTLINYTPELPQDYAKPHFEDLCENPLAIDYFKKNQDKMSNNIYFNPNIFEYDKKRIINKITIYKKELLQKVLNPIRLMKICQYYKIEFINLMENY